MNVNITYVRPVVEYTSVVWSPHNAELIRIVQNVPWHFTNRLPYCSRLSLVTLKCVWDRRVVLSGAHKLKNDDELGRVYIDPYETFESRRQH